MDLKQHGDGSLALGRERDSQDTFRSGGYAGPAASNTPGFLGEGSLDFNIGGGANPLLAWQNVLGYDIIVTLNTLDVTTVSGGACTVSAGVSTTSTGTDHTMMSGQTVASTGTFNGGAVSVKVPQSSFIVLNEASGSASGLVARAFFNFLPSAAAGAG